MRGKRVKQIRRFCRLTNSDYDTVKRIYLQTGKISATSVPMSVVREAEKLLNREPLPEGQPGITPEYVEQKLAESGQVMNKLKIALKRTWYQRLFDFIKNIFNL